MKPLLTVIAIALFAGCVQPQVNLENEKLSIIKCWTDWGSKAEAGDPGYYWTDDVILMGPDGPTIKGKDEFLKMYSGMSNIPGFSIIWDKEPSTIEVSKDGQMAYLFAKNKTSMSDSTGAVISWVNQAIQIWKKDKEGNWKAGVAIMYRETPVK